MTNILKSKMSMKIIIFTMTSAMILTMFIPSLQQNVQASEISDEQIFYQEQVQQNPNFDNELTLSRNYLLNTMNQNTNSEIETAGIVGGSLKAIKGLSPILRHGGTALSWVLKPFSKKSGVVVKRNARKAANAIDKLDKGTKSALENALMSSGVKKRSDAKTIVHIIFLII